MWEWWTMAYSNSPLVNYTRLSPNHSGTRTHTIDRITPHCVVGQLSVETLGKIFAPKSRQASCQYGIGSDGRVALICEEKNRSWCTSSSANDNRAVTIECASDTTHPYAFKQVVYDKLIELCVDICKRNGKKKLLWFNDKAKSLNYSPKSDEMVLTVHRWYAKKSCPGDWLMQKMEDLATKVTARLQGTTPAQQPKEEEIDMTKAEVQKMIDDSVKKALAGADTEVSSWAVKEYDEAKKLGITDGTRPQGYATREQVALMVLRGINKLPSQK